MPKSGATTHIRGTEPMVVVCMCVCVRVFYELLGGSRAMQLRASQQPSSQHTIYVSTCDVFSASEQRTLEQRRGPLLLQDRAEAVAHVAVLLLPARELQPRLHHVRRRGRPGAQRARDAARAEEGADAVGRGSDERDG